MLHLTGNFKIWKEKPQLEQKTVEGEYNGVEYEKDTTFHAFESCKLIEVTVKAKAPEADTSTTDTTFAIRPVAMKGGVTVFSQNGSIFIENAPAGSKFAVTDLNGRVLKASRIASTMHEIRIDNRGVLLVQVGNKAFKVAK